MCLLLLMNRQQLFHSSGTESTKRKIRIRETNLKIIIYTRSDKIIDFSNVLRVKNQPVKANFTAVRNDQANFGFVWSV